jgi:FMN-dependent NADH-azoreductase
MEAERQALALSDALIEKLRTADFYVFAVPMYNFSIPSTFKAYIDQIRPDQTERCPTVPTLARDS